jgi:hypothetical protein
VLFFPRRKHNLGSQVKNLPESLLKHQKRNQNVNDLLNFMLQKKKPHPLLNLLYQKNLVGLHRVKKQSQLLFQARKSMGLSNTKKKKHLIHIHLQLAT